MENKLADLRRLVRHTGLEMLKQLYTTGTYPSVRHRRFHMVEMRSDGVRQLVELGEPEVFRAYQKMWDKAADVVVPLVRQMQIRNGVEPYTPEDYADYGKGTEVNRP